MDRHSVDWSGPIPALVTPFRADGEIDEHKFVENIELMLETGANGVLVGGCTGEFWSLTDEERVRLMRLTASVVKGRGHVLAGTSAIEVDRVIALTRAAKDAGCDGALVLPPYFVALNDDDIHSHFEAVSRAVAFPIIAYNIPANAVNRITPDLIDRLAGVENVVAIKESAGDWLNYYEIFLRVRDRLRVFCGPSHLYGAPATIMGADGTIDIFPNLWHRGCNDIYHLAKAGRIDEALVLQEKGFRLSRIFTSHDMSLYVSTKHAMNRLGLPGGGVRPPFHPLSARQAEYLEAQMIEMELAGSDGGKA
jgi:4-hydroxy-tetrahydrodipicolinate synthase